MENKIKHLEMIQNIISRLANSSSSIKGWCVTLVAALFVLATSSSNTRFVVLAVFPVFMFWILDGYFLWQERTYRGLYDKVRGLAADAIDFSMDTRSVRNAKNTWWNAVFSLTTNLFYGAITIAIIVTVIIINL